MGKYERLYTADEVDGMIARAKAAAPVQPVPLNAGEISRLWKRHTNPDGPHHNPYDDDGLGFARAILAAASTPPEAQRTWVGLTKGDIAGFAIQHGDSINFESDFAYAIERCLKEKNT